MSFAVACPACARRYQVSTRHAGGKVHCKSCGATICIPAAADPSTDVAQPAAVRAASARQPLRRPGLSGVATRWWILGLATLAGVLVVATSFLTPAGLLIAVGLFVGGMLVLLAGKILLVVNAFQEDGTQGLLVLFVPIYPLYYLFSRWPKTSAAAWVHAVGAVTALLAIPTSFGGLVATGRWLEEKAVAEAGYSAVSPLPADLAEFEASVEGDASDEGDVSDEGSPVPNGAAVPRAAGPPPLESALASGAPAAWAAARPSEPAEAYTIKLRRTNGFFDVTADHEVALERELGRVEGYVPGTASVDLSEGTVTLRAPKSLGGRSNVRGALFRAGFVAESGSSARTWVDPTKPYTISRELMMTNGFFDEGLDPSTAADRELLATPGYIRDSARVDLEGKTITYEVLPGSEAERLGSHLLFRAGFMTH